MTLQQNRATPSPAHWDDVQIGDRVRLQRNGQLEHTGRVDNRTADGAVVWVTPEGGSRKLFHITDGYRLTAVAVEGTHDEDS
ncbi:hypothetical protein QFZ79_000551 [Arthrobacter sp. V4I6]|uniref:hypothetical protein n=1 Tax=unclassified Arthrobacter TaxID=235627 RepID=UPI0027854616|nr:MULTISPECIES: hypothetical protein [unclassified Arthrobacter]MDQ0822811.1 hypothetical protein [Arthrobacter sp. V1I7]MDQ0852440.1 hypothetical protein [Arthrobacter sp. V4I6]